MENTMMIQTMALSVVPEQFKSKVAGEPPVNIWKVYVADEKGNVGFLYSSKPIKTTEVVGITLRVKDGKIAPALVKLEGAPALAPDPYL